MTFERTFYQQKYGHEIAANQCAVDGAWCIRSLQMLRKKANGDSPDSASDNPVSFTCAIDNNLAIINYHWIDHAQTYCMAPVVKFEICRDDHFNQFLIWIEAIGQWAVSHVLPEVKKAVSLTVDNSSKQLALREPIKTSQNTTCKEERSLVTALKLSYNNVPWRFEGDAASAVSSSTASWGSPMINEAVFSNIKYPIQFAPRLPLPVQTQIQIPTLDLSASEPRSACSEPAVAKMVRFADPPHGGRNDARLRPALDISLSPWGKHRMPDLPSIPVENVAKPSLDMDSDLVVSKRLGHAMEEIKDLQRQMVSMKQEFSGSTLCLQNELSGLRQSMSTVLRKERLSFKQGSSLRSNTQDGSGTNQTEKCSLNFQKGVSVVTTPTDPTGRAPWSRHNSTDTAPRRPSGLQNVLNVNTNMSASALSDGSKLPSNITIYSPTVITIITNEKVVQEQDVEENEQEQEQTEDTEMSIRVPCIRQNSWSPVLTSHVLCALVPSAMLRVILFGLVLDYCMVSLGGKHAQSVSRYVSNVLESAIIV